MITATQSRAIRVTHVMEIATERRNICTTNNVYHNQWARAQMSRGVPRDGKR